MPLETLPDYRKTLIIVGTSVRKPLPVLQAHLDSLAAQELPDRVELCPVYVPDFTPEQQDAQELLLRWVNARGGTLIRGRPSVLGDFDDQHPDSHQWSASAMARVGQNKNLILQYALHRKADYVFLCDADLMLDTTTVASLLADEKPISTAVYWTHWSKHGLETLQIHAAPQVWLRHPYQLDGRGMDEAEFRQQLVSRAMTRVWGYGACTLIQRRVLEAGISFAYLPDVPLQGLMAGEDRHFCLRAERSHIEAWADPWPDIFHIYHPDDTQAIPEMARRVGRVHPRRAALGDLVSLRLRPLEPVPVGPGRWQQPPPVLARGRLGTVPLMPEIEEAVYHVARGEKQIVRMHCPIHHPMPGLRGRIRLIEVELIDCKPFGFPPVLEDELYVGPSSRAVQDYVALNHEQHVSIREVGGA